jgi:hypothetical protein
MDFAICQCLPVIGMVDFKNCQPLPETCKVDFENFKGLPVMHQVDIKMNMADFVTKKSPAIGVLSNKVGWQFQSAPIPAQYGEFSLATETICWHED